MGSAAATATTATTAFVVAAIEQQDGDDDQPNGVILKQTAEAVIHNEFLLEVLGCFSLPTTMI